MKKFIQLFNKVGGKEILRQYLHGHVLIYSLLMTLMLGFDKKSLEIVRLAVNNRLLKIIRKKYKGVINSYLELEKNASNEEKREIRDEGNENQKKVWVCWFQGMDQAPYIVRKCYQSLQRHISDREIIVITDQNYKNFVQFPEFIQRKIDAEIISKTHMSDLLRLELLKNYGGTWIDSTVFCTGKCPDYMLDADLFLFQNLKPGLNGKATCISNWFMTAKKNNKIICLTLALLYEYWEKNNQLSDYFIFHDFFQLAIEVYSNEWSRVIPFSNATPHILLLRLFEQYDEKVWCAVKEQTVFHKLTYKFTDEQSKLDGTYYMELFMGGNGND